MKNEREAVIMPPNYGPLSQPAIHLLSQGALAAFITVFLVACQTPPIKDRIVEVKVPVAVQPIKPDQVPILPAPLDPRPSSLSAAADQLLAKVCEFVAYGLKADPLLKVSSGQQPIEVRAYPECER